MVEFKGDATSKLPFGAEAAAVLWLPAERSRIIHGEAVPDDVPGHWRAQFDLAVEAPSRSRCVYC